MCMRTDMYMCMNTLQGHAQVGNVVELNMGCLAPLVDYISLGELVVALDRLSHPLITGLLDDEVSYALTVLVETRARVARPI